MCFSRERQRHGPKDTALGDLLSATEDADAGFHKALALAGLTEQRLLPAGVSYDKTKALYRLQFQVEGRRQVRKFRVADFSDAKLSAAQCRMNALTVAAIVHDLRILLEGKVPVPTQARRRAAVAGVYCHSHRLSKGQKAWTYQVGARGQRKSGGCYATPEEACAAAAKARPTVSSSATRKVRKGPATKRSRRRAV